MFCNKSLCSTETYRSRLYGSSLALYEGRTYVRCTGKNSQCVRWRLKKEDFVLFLFFSQRDVWESSPGVTRVSRDLTQDPNLTTTNRSRHIVQP